jgi:hypothetical protein
MQAQRVQSLVTTLVGVAVVLLAVWLVARNFQPPKAVGKDPNPPRVSEDGGGLSALGGTDAGTGSGLGGLSADGGLLMVSDLVQQEPRVDGGPWSNLFDGSLVPPLPLNAPRQVRFGVVLVSYEGAQPSPAAMRPSTRSKNDAKALVQKLALTAAADFHAAVQQGDAGSSDDVGRVKLGILEPAPEYVLFTLPIDGVGGPIDTPRGYWIVKRLE